MLAIMFLDEKASRNIAIVAGLLMVVVSAMLGANFHPGQVGMQFVEQVSWIKAPFPVEYHVGVDGLSLSLVGLTSLVTLLSIVASKNIGEHRPRLYYSMVMLLTIAILGVFVSLDLVQCFVLYELELIPMYFLIA